MFGEMTFSDSTFSDIYPNFLIVYLRTHGRTKVQAVVELSTGHALIINPNNPIQNYTIRTKVEKNITIKTDSKPYS
jgi:hypothetical protein